MSAHKINSTASANVIKFTLKLLLLLLLIFIANNIIFYTFHLPRFWAVDYQKTHFYEKYKLKYNTVFIGSSLTYYQVDPHLFDSLNAASGIYTKSFNYGIGGACPTELFSTFEYLANSKSDSLQKVFCELTLIDNFDMGQMHTLRRTSSFNLEQYVQAVPLTLQSNYSLLSKASFSLFDLSNVTEGAFKINMLKDALDFRKKRHTYDTITDMADFMALSIADPTKGIDPKGKYGNRHQRFLKESLSELKTNTASARIMFTDKNFLANAKTDNEYIKMVTRMLQIAKQKGIELIFILPPRLSNENYKDLLPVYYSIPNSHRIQLADANEYPEFYKIEYSYDIKHINEYCVPVFTSALSASFIKVAPCN